MITALITLLSAVPTVSSSESLLPLDCATHLRNFEKQVGKAKHCLSRETYLNPIASMTRSDWILCRGLLNLHHNLVQMKCENEIEPEGEWLAIAEGESVKQILYQDYEYFEEPAQRPGESAEELKARRAKEYKAYLFRSHPSLPQPSHACTVLLNKLSSETNTYPVDCFGTASPESMRYRELQKCSQVLRVHKQAVDLGCETSRDPEGKLSHILTLAISSREASILRDCAASCLKVPISMKFEDARNCLVWIKRLGNEKYKKPRSLCEDHISQIQDGNHTRAAMFREALENAKSVVKESMLEITRKAESMKFKNFDDPGMISFLEPQSSLVIGSLSELVEELALRIEDMILRLTQIKKFHVSPTHKKAAAAIAEALTQYYEGLTVTSDSAPEEGLINKITDILKLLGGLNTAKRDVPGISLIFRRFINASRSRAKDPLRPMTFMNSIGTCWLSATVHFLLALPNLKHYLGPAPQEPFSKELLSIVSQRESGEAVMFLVRLRQTLPLSMTYCQGLSARAAIEAITGWIPGLNDHLLHFFPDTSSVSVEQWERDRYALTQILSKHKASTGKVYDAISISSKSRQPVSQISTLPPVLKLASEEYRLILSIEGTCNHVWANLWVEAANKWYELSDDKASIVTGALPTQPNAIFLLLLYIRTEH